MTQLETTTMTEPHKAAKHVTAWLLDHPAYAAVAKEIIDDSAYNGPEDLAAWFEQLLYDRSQKSAPPYAIARSLDDLAKHFTAHAFWNIDWTEVVDVLTEGE